MSERLPHTCPACGAHFRPGEEEHLEEHRTLCTNWMHYLPYYPVGTAPVEASGNAWARAHRSDAEALIASEGYIPVPPKTASKSRENPQNTPAGDEKSPISATCLKCGLPWRSFATLRDAQRWVYDHMGSKKHYQQ